MKADFINEKVVNDGMKKILAFLVCLVLAASGCGRKEAQKVAVKTVSYPGWVEIKAGEQASFQVPSQLILQSEEYRQAQLAKAGLDPLIKRWLMEDTETAKSAGCVVVQNSVIGKVPWIGKESFAKVEFKTMHSPEKMPRYGQNLGLKEAEIKEFGDITQKSIRGMAAKNLPQGYEIRFKNWKPMASDIINGVENLHTAYDEEVWIRGQKKLTLHVERWTFFNRDRVHTLIVSWNARDNAMWTKEETKLANVVNTLNITPSTEK